MTASFESIFVEVVMGKNITYIVDCIYRPLETNVDLFLTYLDKIIRLISKKRQKCYILGDVNIDLLKYETDTRSNELLDTFATRSFFLIITRPPRITRHSATLIDNIFTNETAFSNIKTRIIYSSISDHLPIVLISDIDRPRCNDLPK